MQIADHQWGTHRPSMRQARTWYGIIIAAAMWCITIAKGDQGTNDHLIVSSMAFDEPWPGLATCNISVLR